MSSNQNSNGTDLYSTTTRFSKAVSATASALIHPSDGSNSNDALLSNSSYKNVMRDTLNSKNSLTLTRRRNNNNNNNYGNHGNHDLYGSKYATSTDFFKNAFSSSKTAYKVLTHIPDDLLDEIPNDDDDDDDDEGEGESKSSSKSLNKKNSFSLFQGFNAVLPAIDEEITLNKKLDEGNDFLQKLTNNDDKSQDQDDDQDQDQDDFKLPNGLTKDKILNSYSTNKLSNYKSQLNNNLELLEIRKNLAASEIIEIDNKISKLNSLRKIVFKRVAKIEQNEFFLENHLQDIDDRIQMIKDYNMEQPDEDEINEIEKDENSINLSNKNIYSSNNENNDIKNKNNKNNKNNDDKNNDKNNDDNNTFQEGKPLMSQSIYGKLKEKPPTTKFKKKHHQKFRKTMPTLQQYYEPGTEIRSIQAHDESINCFDFDIPFGTMVSASLDNTVRVWDLSKGKCLGLLNDHIAPVSSIQMDDSIVITGSLDATLKLWDLNKLNNYNYNYNYDENDNDNQNPCLYTFESHIEEITALSFHNSNLVSGSQDRTLRQWDLQTGHCLQTIDVLWASQMNQTTNIDTSMIVDKVNPFIGCLQTYDAALATGTSDGLVRLWDLRSGEVVRSLIGHTAPVTCLQFDDKYLTTGSLDRSIRIWDLRTGGIHDAFAYESPITSLQFDSKKIISSNCETTAKIYDRIDEKHSSCGGKDTDSSIINYVRYKEGYLIEGRADGKIGVWAV